MNVPSELYRVSLALLTDLYQLTMAHGYWKLGRTDQQAAFHLFFRKNPFQGGYTIACGLSYVIDFVQRFRFDEADTEYLSSLAGNDGKPLFEPAFLEYLAGLKGRGVGLCAGSDCHDARYRIDFEAAGEMLGSVGIADGDLWVLPPRDRQEFFSAY